MGLLITDLIGKFAQRRQEKMASSYEKARAQAALEDIQSEQGFRALEDPREQAQLRQSLAGRGLSKSSIAQQDTARLIDTQARRNAALGRQNALATQGLSLIKKRRRYARRIFPLEVFNEITAQAQQAAGMAGGMMGGGVPAEE